jgi:predicted acyl esterase
LFVRLTFAEDTASQPLHKVIVEKAVPVPMRDGINLGAEDRPDAAGKFPVLLCQRYFREGADHGQFFAQRGYVVRSSIRAGAATAKANGSRTSTSRKTATIFTSGWAHKAGRPARSAPFGISYNGFTRVMPAPLGSPYLTCLFPEENQQTNFGHL